MVGHLVLVQAIGVRIPVPEQSCERCFATETPIKKRFLGSVFLLCNFLIFFTNSLFKGNIGYRYALCDFKMFQAYLFVYK